MYSAETKRGQVTRVLPITILGLALLQSATT
jgi:hypothetical protein